MGQEWIRKGCGSDKVCNNLPDEICFPMRQCLIIDICFVIRNRILQLGINYLIKPHFKFFISLEYWWYFFNNLLAQER